MTLTVRILAHSVRILSVLKNHVDVEAPDNSGKKNEADQSNLEDHREDVEALNLNQHVGATYEDNFIRKIELLPVKKQRKAQQDLIFVLV